jgi:two-component system phosphoglycerate transport system response regulator PgtA
LPNNILLVDDDETIIDTYQAILEMEGYTVHTASNPYKAIQIIQDQDIQLAILDYNLPNMTGTELGRLVKKFNQSIGIMFISGNSEIHEIVKKVKYDVCKVFSKPIELEQLLLTVKSTMGESQDSIAPDIRMAENIQTPNKLSRLVENITKIFPIQPFNSLFTRAHL